MNAGFSPTTRALITCNNVSRQLVKDVEINNQAIFQDHFKNTRDEIVHIIEKLKGTAVVFGAGAALDLPLIVLANRFKHIVLVDIDITYTKKALKQIPSEFQENFLVQQADLTGVFTELSIEAEKIAERRLPYEEFIASLMDLLPTLKPREFDCSSLHPTFVCSSMVGSQLNANILLYFEALSQEYYGQFFDAGSRNEEFCSWLEQIQINHLDYIRRVVEPEGTVYFSDHISMDNFVQYGEQEYNLVSLESLGARKINEFIQNNFSTLSTAKWSWTHPDSQFINIESFVDFGNRTLRLGFELGASMKRYQISAFSFKLS